MEALVARGVRQLTWVGDANPTAGSTVPCALVHPFAGRSFAPRPGLFEAWQTTVAWLKSLPDVCKVHHAPLRRVADSASPGGARLLRSLKRHAAELKLGFGTTLELPTPPVPAQDTTLVYGPTYAVDLRASVQWCHNELARQGLPLRSTQVVRIEKLNAGWRLHCDDGQLLSAREVVICAGLGARKLLQEHVPTDHLEHVQGLLVHQRQPPLTRFTIERGHIASTRERVAWGSSFNSCDRPSPNPAMAQLEAIQSRLLSSCPALPRLGQASIWQGVRVVDRLSRQPWVANPRPGLHVFTAFGSQGVLWIPLLARRWAERWVNSARHHEPIR